MSNEVTTPPEGPEADDGFSVSSRSQRVGRGSYLKWNDKQGWVDRDGVAAPSPLLVVGVNEILRRWKDKLAEYIVEKPLPDPDELNAAIPVQEWEAGVDGKPRPPWHIRSWSTWSISRPERPTRMRRRPAARILPLTL